MMMMVIVDNGDNSISYIKKCGIDRFSSRL